MVLIRLKHHDERANINDAQMIGTISTTLVLMAVMMGTGRQLTTQEERPKLAVTLRQRERDNVYEK